LGFKNELVKYFQQPSHEPYSVVHLLLSQQFRLPLHLEADHDVAKVLLIMSEVADDRPYLVLEEHSVTLESELPVVLGVVAGLN
jgi:predicted class III extradiol MEMO1 family dioxygenase